MNSDTSTSGLVVVGRPRICRICSASQLGKHVVVQSCRYMRLVVTQRLHVSYVHASPSNLPTRQPDSTGGMCSKSWNWSQSAKKCDKSIPPAYHSGQAAIASLKHSWSRSEALASILTLAGHLIGTACCVLFECDYLLAVIGTRMPGFESRAPRSRPHSRYRMRAGPLARFSQLRRRCPGLWSHVPDRN